MRACTRATLFFIPASSSRVGMGGGLLGDTMLSSSMSNLKFKGCQIALTISQKKRTKRTTPASSRRRLPSLAFQGCIPRAKVRRSVTCAQEACGILTRLAG